MPLPIKPGKDWTLFLDRDGVINYEKHLDYINNWSEFAFYEDAKEALAGLTAIFGRTVIVTNQKGVGRGITNRDELHRIHANMHNEIGAAGGTIDAIYYCDATDNNDINRKPNPGMAWQAKNEFPEIEFSRSMIVGNNISDLEFGRNAGMYTCFLRTTQPALELPPGLADMEAVSLKHLLQQLNTL